MNATQDYGRRVDLGQEAATTMDNPIRDDSVTDDSAGFGSYYVPGLNDDDFGTDDDEIVEAEDVDDFEMEDENDLPDEIPVSYPHLCVACQCDFDEDMPIRSTCGHRWHKSCLNQNFRIALQSRNSWPPKCCNRRQGIDILAVKIFLDADVCELLHKHEEEFSTPNPIYCPTCHRFLPTRNIHGIWTACCKTSLCVECGSPQSDHHWSHGFGKVNCPDKLSVEDRALASREGWCPCPVCRNLVERIDGCNNMLCPSCKTRFCYECGGARDTGEGCACGTWNFEETREREQEQEDEEMDDTELKKELFERDLVPDDVQGAAIFNARILAQRAARVLESFLEGYKDRSDDATEKTHKRKGTSDDGIHD